MGLDALDELGGLGEDLDADQASASSDILAVGAPPMDLTAKKPFKLLLVLGVNGVGKTTTIGKLAATWKADGKRVLLAAGDTFRAAATEQLEEWAKRAGTSTSSKGKPNGDPSSVIFDAIKKASTRATTS